MFEDDRDLKRKHDAIVPAFPANTEHPDFQDDDYQITRVAQAAGESADSEVKRFRASPLSGDEISSEDDDSVYDSDGRNEELEEGSSFSSIIWVFNSDGSLSLSFDGTNTSSGQWEFLGSNLDGTKRYTLDFIQYPNEGKFTFAVSPNFSSNNTRMNIRLYQGSQQWIRDRVLVKD